MKGRTLLLAGLSIGLVAVSALLGYRVFTTGDEPAKSEPPEAPDATREPRPKPPPSTTPARIDAPAVPEPGPLNASEVAPRSVVAEQVHVQLPSRIRGRVVDPYGATIEGARIALDVFDLDAVRASKSPDDFVVNLAKSKKAGTSDAEPINSTPIAYHAETVSGHLGEFVLNDVPIPAPDVLSPHRDRLTITGAGFSATTAYPYLRRPGDFVMQRRAVVIVRLREDENDAPIPDTTVAIIGSDGAAQITTSDDASQFTSKEPIAEGNATIVVFRPGHGVVTAMTPIRGDLAEVEVPSYPTYTLTFVDAEDGTKLSGVVVHDAISRRFDAVSHLVQPIGASDVSGTLKIEDLRPQSRLVVERSGYSQEIVRVKPSTNGFNAPETQTVKLTKSVIVTGRLIDRFGKPLHDIPIDGDDRRLFYFDGLDAPGWSYALSKLLAPDEDEEQDPLATGPKTDGEGRFRIVVRASPYPVALLAGEPYCEAYRSALGSVLADPPGATLDRGDVGIEPDLLVNHEPREAAPKYSNYHLAFETVGPQDLDSACCDILVPRLDGKKGETLAGFGFTSGGRVLGVKVPRGRAARVIHFDGFHEIAFLCAGNMVEEQSDAWAVALDQLVKVTVTLTDGTDQAPATPIEVRWSSDGEHFFPYYLKDSIEISNDGAFVLHLPPALLHDELVLEAREADSDGGYESIGRTNPAHPQSVDARRQWQTRKPVKVRNFNIIWNR